MPLPSRLNNANANGNQQTFTSTRNQRDLPISTVPEANTGMVLIPPMHAANPLQLKILDWADRTRIVPLLLAIGANIVRPNAKIGRTALRAGATLML